MKNFEKIISELENKVKTLEEKVNFLMASKTNTFKPETNLINSTTAERDKTKYMFEGKVYGKNKLVYAVVLKYTQNNKNLTYSDLSNVFSKSLQGSLGVVATMSQANNRADAHKRYFMQQPILLADQQVVVCTQWGAFNIVNFLLRAKELGFIITTI